MKLDNDEFRGRRVVVMGLGRFGGGIGVTRYLAAAGARVLVTDSAKADTLRESVAALADLSVEFRLGEHREDDLRDADLLVINPAVDRRTNPFFQAALQRGIPWTTEMNLFLARCPGRILAVTGTIGKSTTCAMLHAILDDAEAATSAGIDRAFLGGNIGVSLLPALHEMTARTAVVLELSSFQLEAAESANCRVSVAGLTNARPHHLERHGRFDAYLDAKLNLFRKLGPDGTAVSAADDEAVDVHVREVAAQRDARFLSAVYRGEPYALRVPGRHNQANAHMAVVMAAALGVDAVAAERAVGRYAGLPHRLEFVGTAGGVRYYNDSKSTSAEAVATALAAFSQPTVLLCGGKDIGAELDRIVDSPWDHLRAAICFGEAGPRLAALLARAVQAHHGCAVTCHLDLNEAAHAARAAAKPGDVVVLSPGCPSYDAFANYEKRGEAFRALVRSWT